MSHDCTDRRLVPCSRCGGDREFEIWTGYDPRDGSATGYWQKCDACDGTGSEEITMLPIEMDDLP